VSPTTPTFRPTHANGASGGRPTRRPGTAIEPGTATFGYVSVGDDERLVNGEEYGAQARAIEAFCERRGLRLVQIIRDVAPEHERLTARPGLHHGVEALARGEARALVVNDLGRLTRSPSDLGRLLRWFSESGRTLISLDTSTLAGRHADYLPAR
jgi:DNA invertase Pin-like site-specific DNA recombinase